MQPLPCIEPECWAPAFAKQLCRKHYDAHRRCYDDASRLACLCWCEAEVVWVFASEIQAGRTGRCYRPQCHPPIP